MRGLRRTSQTKGNHNNLNNNLNNNIKFNNDS
jgi:hypothetical protein